MLACFAFEVPNKFVSYYSGLLGVYLYATPHVLSQSSGMQHGVKPNRLRWSVVDSEMPNLAYTWCNRISRSELYIRIWSIRCLASMSSSLLKSASSVMFFRLRKLYIPLTLLALKVSMNRPNVIQFFTISRIMSYMLPPCSIYCSICLSKPLKARFASETSSLIHAAKYTP